MPKRPDALETVRIVLELLKRIPRSQRVSAIDLHQQLQDAGFGRDLRTIQRLLETICEHFEVDRDDRSKPYLYRWKEKASGFSIPGLNRQEALLLALAERQLGVLLPQKLAKSLSAYYKQARTDIGQKTDARLEKEWLTKVRVISQTQPLLPPTLQSGVLEAVSDALYGNCWLKLSYKNATGRRSDAEVMPLGLAQQGVRLYLVCRFRGYDDDRNLALNRVQVARCTTIAFERPKDFDLQKFDDDGQFGFGDGTRVRLSFKISKEAGHHLTETPLSADQTIRASADHYAISATLTNSKQLEWWLRSFGPDVYDIRRRRLERSSRPRVRSAK